MNGIRLQSVRDLQNGGHKSLAGCLHYQVGCPGAVQLKGYLLVVYLIFTLNKGFTTFALQIINMGSVSTIATTAYLCLNKNLSLQTLLSSMYNIKVGNTPMAECKQH